jgi:type I restriction enzyme S subunit
MEEYRTYTLEELTSGKGSYGIAASAVPFEASLHTYLRITDINDDGSLNKSGLMSVDEDDAEKYLLKPNDIVFARTGNSTGRSYFYDGSDGELVYAGFLIKFTLDSAKVNPRILKYYTHSKPYYDWVQSFGTGSTRGNINAKTYGNMPITLPPRDIQDKIVEILKSLDDKIEVNKQINDNLEQQAQALFKSWFVDFEPFHYQTFVESELGMIPKGFKIVSIGEMPLTVTDYVANGSFASLKENVNLYEDENYAYFIRNTDLKSKDFCVYVDEHSYNFLSKSKLEGGEIIISNVGDVGSVHLCPYLDKPMTLGNNIIMVKPYDEFYRNFLYILFKWNYGQDLIQSIKGGSAQPKFNKTDFKSLKIIVPNEAVLKEFDEIVSSTFKYIAKNDEENKEVTTLRDTLLPRLMSGEFNFIKTNM